MRHLVTYALALLPALSLAAPALKERPAPDPLLGRWAAEDMSINGQSEPQWQGLEYEFAPGGQWHIYRNGREERERPRTFTADNKAKLPAIDLTEGKDTYLGMYRVGPGRDTLTVSFTFAKGGGRPAGPEPGPAIMTITFRRVEAK